MHLDALFLKQNIQLAVSKSFSLFLTQRVFGLYFLWWSGSFTIAHEGIQIPGLLNQL